jgi:hypothetical protein
MRGVEDRELALEHPNGQKRKFQSNLVHQFYSEKLS